MHSIKELNKRIWFLGISVVIVLGVIAVIYYNYTRAVGLQNCAAYAAAADKDLAQLLKDNQGVLGQTNYSFKDNTCYEAITESFYATNPEQLISNESYIENLYTQQTVSGCTLEGGTAEVSTTDCQKYDDDFNRIFYHLY